MFIECRIERAVGIIAGKGEVMSIGYAETTRIITPAYGIGHGTLFGIDRQLDARKPDARTAGIDGLLTI